MTARHDVALVFLDSAAAFDTTGHMILLVERIESYFAFSKLTLNWFMSYLENQRQSIIIGDEVSTPRALCYGVPQRSMLGPLLFTLHVSAHETQLFIAIDPANQAPSQTAFQICMDYVMRWTMQNMQRSDAEKTEVIVHIPIYQDV